jgi:hypothetical protein
MKKFLSTIVGASAAAACLTFAPPQADADLRHRCSMEGTWIEASEHWVFDADYWLMDNGADTFSGVFANPAAGAVANIHGIAASGTWDIKFNYTDAAHAGWVRHLVGNGYFNRGSHRITVSGTETLKKSGVRTGSGTFSMTGKCRSI